MPIKFFLLVFLCLSFGCATQEQPKVSADAPNKINTADDNGACFEAAVANSFIPGKTTKLEIRKTLGKQYPDPRMNDEFWTYLYTYKKHVSFVFKDDVMVERHWGTEYGIDIESDKCWPSFERVQEWMRNSQKISN